MSTWKSKHKASLWAKRLKDAMIQNHWWPKYTSKSICSCSWSRKTVSGIVTISPHPPCSQSHLCILLPPIKTKQSLQEWFLTALCSISQGIISGACLFLTWWYLLAQWDWDFAVLNTLKNTWKRPCVPRGLPSRVSSRAADQHDMDFLSAGLITSAGSVPCFEGNCAVKEGLDLQCDSCWRTLSQEDKISVCSWIRCLMQVLINTSFF